MKFLNWVVVILLGISSMAYAAVYTYTDKSGNTVYTDIPHEQNSKVVTVSEPVGIHSSVASEAPAPVMTQGQFQNQSKLSETLAKPVDAERPIYKKFIITQPANKQTLQNPETITVMLEIDPSLFKSDQIQLLLDNKLVGEAVHATTLSLPWIERGEHHIAAIILDKDKRVIKQSNSVEIFIQRANLNSPARVNN